MATHKDLSQDFFHPRVHALGRPRVEMVGRIEVVVIDQIHTRNMPED